MLSSQSNCTLYLLYFTLTLHGYRLLLVCSLITGQSGMPRVRRHKLTLINRHPLFHNPVTHVQGQTVLGRWNTQPLSRHILIIDTSKFVHCFSIYNSNPFYTVGLQFQSTWRALCLGLCIRHDSRGVGKVLRSSKPLNSQGPRSLVVFEARVASCF